MSLRSKLRMSGGIAGIVLAIMLWISLAVVPVAGYATHIITTVRDESYVLLTVGLIIPPVGVVHGWGNWVGLWSVKEENEN